MAQEKLFQIGIKALVTDKDDRVLVLFSGDWHLKNQSEHWDIPGGRIQEGSTPLETLQREVEEETGIKKIQKSKLLTAVVSNFKDMPVGDRMVGLALMIYKVEVPAGSKITLSHEHSNYEWVDKQEAAKRLAYKYPPEFTDLL